jgi:PAS domain S-box-containing protein
MPLPLDSFKRVTERSSAAIAICTPEHHISWANAAHMELFGYHPEGLAARNCAEFMHPDDREVFRCASEELFADPSRRVRWESRVVGPRGFYLWVENTFFACPGVGTVLYQYDIHARKTAELACEVRASEFAAANERLRDFAFGAAHDLREPLRSISACTELLVRGATSGNSRELATFITSGVARMSALIDDMLSFAMADVQQLPVPVDLDAAVALATQDLKVEIARTGASVIVGRLPTVMGVETQYGRIFQNLIANAIKYKGSQSITIEITAEFSGAEWVVAVRDNGLGIGVEHQAEIFLPFKRIGNSDAPGSGLGLALTRKIVERFGGVIWVQSELGCGSTFLFSIPAESSNANKTNVQTA